MSAVNPTSPYPFDALQNADFIASWNTKDDPYSKRVQCNYGVSGGQGAVTIQGLNLYGGSAAAEHGMKLSISGILDSVPNGSTGFLNTSGAWIEQANYWTDQGSDQALGRGSYSKNGNCSLNMKVKKVMAASPCASDQTGGASSAITIDGAYSCANLHSLQGDVKVDNGAFYCETSTSDACIGGGTTNPGVPIAPR